MKDSSIAVYRLLNSISHVRADENISVLALILNYSETQLKRDISSIQFVEIKNKTESS